MRRNWILLWQPDEANWPGAHASLPTHQVRLGQLRLATDQPALQTVDGKALGVFDGVIFNERALAEPLKDRGAPIVDQPSLALHAIGWSGLQGLGGLRWHGTLAVLHQAQRTAIVARDWQGVGGLYWAPLGRGHLFANTAQALAAFDVSPRLVPPGMLALCTPSGVRWQVLPSQPEARAWFRDLPEELADPTPERWRAGLLARLDLAVQAVRRELPSLVRDEPTDPSGLWLVQQLPLPPVAVPDGIWTLAGSEAWLGRSTMAPVEPQPGPWPLPEPPEPLRVDDREAHARRVRASWLADVALETARLDAEVRNLPLVAPQLDPAVLAWLGAMPRALRPLA